MKQTPKKSPALWLFACDVKWTQDLIPVRSFSYFLPLHRKQTRMRLTPLQQKPLPLGAAHPDPPYKYTGSRSPSYSPASQSGSWGRPNCPGSTGSCERYHLDKPRRWSYLTWREKGMMSFAFNLQGLKHARHLHIHSKNDPCKLVLPLCSAGPQRERWKDEFRPVASCSFAVARWTELLWNMEIK